MKKTVLIINSFSVCVAYLLHDSKYILLLYVLASMMDYFSAIFRVLANREKWSRKKALSGIFKKMNMLFYVFITISVDFLMKESNLSFIQGGITRLFLIWLTVNELLSILDNIEKTKGTRGSKWLRMILEKLRDKGELK